MDINLLCLLIFQTYHYCYNSQLQTFTCPEGQAFHHLTSKCEDVSVAECIETMGDHEQHDHHYHHHHHHKRSIEELHVIDIEHAKAEIVEAYRAIEPIVIQAVESIAPSIYTKFQRDYVPELKKFKDEVMPFVNQKILPEVRKRYQFVRNLLQKIFEKIYRSYELSNSTHITIVSFNDVIEDVSNEVKPLIDLGRYLTSKVVKKA